MQVDEIQDTMSFINIISSLLERSIMSNVYFFKQGNVRVFCRVRPLLGDETLGNNGEIAHLHFPDEDHKVLELEKLADMNPNEVKNEDIYAFIKLLELVTQNPTNFLLALVYVGSRTHSCLHVCDVLS